jgi:hypothetical protein
MVIFFLAFVDFAFFFGVVFFLEEVFLAAGFFGASDLTAFFS